MVSIGNEAIYSITERVAICTEFVESGWRECICTKYGVTSENVRRWIVEFRGDSVHWRTGEQSLYVASLQVDEEQILKMRAVERLRSPFRNQMEMAEELDIISIVNRFIKHNYCYYDIHSLMVGLKQSRVDVFQICQMSLWQFNAIMLKYKQVHPDGIIVSGLETRLKLRDVCEKSFNIKNKIWLRTVRARELYVLGIEDKQLLSMFYTTPRQAVEIKKKQIKEIQDVKDTILSEYDQGKSIAELTKVYKVSAGIIFSWIYGNECDSSTGTAEEQDYYCECEYNDACRLPLSKSNVFVSISGVRLG